MKKNTIDDAIDKAIESNIGLEHRNVIPLPTAFKEPAQPSEQVVSAQIIPFPSPKDDIEDMVNGLLYLGGLLRGWPDEIALAMLDAGYTHPMKGLADLLYDGHFDGYGEFFEECERREQSRMD